MTETDAVSLEDVRRMAELAQLELTSEEETRMQRDLSAILGYVQQLNELDTSEVEPLAQISELLHGAETEENASLREDEVRASLDHKQVMASAPVADESYFKVPKVIER